MELQFLGFRDCLGGGEACCIVSDYTYSPVESFISSHLTLDALTENYVCEVRDNKLTKCIFKKSEHMTEAFRSATTKTKATDVQLWYICFSLGPPS